MNKKQIQQRVLQNGKPLKLNKFMWDEKSLTFTTDENNLVFDLRDVDGAHFSTGSGCTFSTGSGCTFTTGWGCAFKTGSGCTFKTGSDCTIEAFCGSIVNVLGERCVIVNRNVFEVITPKKGDVVQICPYNIEGYLLNGMYKGKPHIIADRILSRIIHQRGNVFKVVNHGSDKQTYLVKAGDTHADGETLKKAREALVYKCKERDTSAYDNWTVEREISFAEAISMYRTITGACEDGCRYFVEQNQDKKKDKYTVSEVIELTRGQFGHEALVEFFNKKGNNK